MQNEVNKNFGKRIQYLRKQRGISQEKLAEMLDIATTSLSYVKTGRGFMTLSTIEKVAKILNVEIYELFQFSSLQTTDEMCEYIFSKINIIKNDNNKLNLIYNICKGI